MEYYPVIKKNKILSLEKTWMDLEGIMLSEISEAEKDKCPDLTYIWNLKMKAQNTNWTYREQAGGCQRWGSVSKKGEGGQKVKTSK